MVKIWVRSKEVVGMVKVKGGLNGKVWWKFRATLNHRTLWYEKVDNDNSCGGGGGVEKNDNNEE